jgi:UDP-N-acetylglucosamine 2-epimerase (non-hydrolysing)
LSKKLLLITGARPNFVKAAPLIKELRKHGNVLESLLVHTGQHYDRNLSELFFEQLQMPQPDIYLGVGSGSHSRQTAAIMIGLEDAFIEQKPDLAVVFGDVNSTLAAAIVAAKMGIRLAHVEAGLRSFDMSMPEEINRIVTDRLSDYCFISEQSGLINLQNEGKSNGQLFFVGNIMIDSLMNHLKACRESTILDSLGLRQGEYAVLTLHRPSNVDSRDKLERVLSALNEIGREIQIIFPCHPRTRKELANLEMSDQVSINGIRILDPIGYIDFLRLQSDAKFVLTDSGGIQEETTYLGIPCITLRYNTERPVTVEKGSNILTGSEPDKIISAVRCILDGTHKKGEIPPLWDGATSGRITDILIREIG